MKTVLYSLVLFCLVIAGCSPAQAAVPATDTPVPPTATASMTPTFTPTVTPTSTPSPTPTQTSTPTITPTPTPEVPPNLGRLVLTRNELPQEYIAPDTSEDKKLCKNFLDLDGNGKEEIEGSFCLTGMTMPDWLMGNVYRLDKADQASLFANYLDAEASDTTALAGFDSLANRLMVFFKAEDTPELKVMAALEGVGNRIVNVSGESKSDALTFEGLAFQRGQVGVIIVHIYASYSVPLIRLDQVGLLQDGLVRGDGVLDVGLPVLASLSPKDIPDVEDADLPSDFGGGGLIFFQSDRVDDTYQIFSTTPLGSDVKQITKAGRPKYSPAVSADGKFVTYDQERDEYTNNQVLMNLETGKTSTFAQYTYASGDWSDDGKTYAFSQWNFNTETYDVYIANFKGQGFSSSFTPITKTKNSGEFLPDISPDGQRLLYVVWDNEEDSAAIFIDNIDGNQAEPLVHTLGNQWAPSWSPDGQRIVFVTETDTFADLYVVNADGTGLRKLTDSVEFSESPDWSPDGQWIVFASDRTGNNDIYIIKLDGSLCVNLTHSDDYDQTPEWWGK